MMQCSVVEIVSQVFVGTERCVRVTALAIESSTVMNSWSESRFRSSAVCPMISGRVTKAVFVL